MESYLLFDFSFVKYLFEHESVDQSKNTLICTKNQPTESLAGLVINVL